MARNHHVQHQVLTDIREMSTEELEAEYGIEVGNVIWDQCARRTFKNLQTWALYIIAQEEEENYGGERSMSGSKSRYDDDRY